MKWQLTEDPEPLVRLAITVFLGARRALMESPLDSQAYLEARIFLLSTTWAHLMCGIDGDIARERIVEPLEAAKGDTQPPAPRTLLGKRSKLELAARICSTTRAGADVAGYRSKAGYIRACRRLGIPIRCLGEAND